MHERKKGKEHSGTILDTVKEYDVIECEQCGFRHIVPIPSPEKLEEVYRDEYYLKEKPLYLERYREDLDWWNLTYRERYDRSEKFLAKDRRRILDIGSGPGFFLLHGKERGWETVGIEPSKQAARHSKDLGLEIVEEFLSGDTVEDLGRFDVAHLSQVLEHILIPLKCWIFPAGCFFQAAALYHRSQRLQPFPTGLKGSVRVRSLVGGTSSSHQLLFHESLSRLLLNNGFEIVDHTTTFPIDMFLLMGDNYLGNDTLGRECHKKRMNFEQNLAKAGKGELRAELYSALSNLEIGREILLTARKKIKWKNTWKNRRQW